MKISNKKKGKELIPSTLFYISKATIIEDTVFLYRLITLTRILMHDVIKSRIWRKEEERIPLNSTFPRQRFYYRFYYIPPRFQKWEETAISFTLATTPKRRRGEERSPALGRDSPPWNLWIPRGSAADSFRSPLRNTSDTGQTAGDTPLIHACSAIDRPDDACRR